MIAAANRRHSQGTDGSDGHFTTRAAMIYQYNAEGRDQVIASALDKLIEQEREARAGQPGGRIADDVGEEDHSSD
jgi:hypothetical protein